MKQQFGILDSSPGQIIDLDGNELYGTLVSFTDTSRGYFDMTESVGEVIATLEEYIISTYVYKKGLLDGDYGFSTAVGLFNTVINVILLVTMNSLVKKMNDGKGI